MVDDGYVLLENGNTLSLFLSRYGARCKKQLIVVPMTSLWEVERTKERARERERETKRAKAFKDGVSSEQRAVSNDIDIDH